MRSSLALGTLPALLVLALAACDRNVEPYVEGEQPREPDLARIFPESGDGPGARAPQAVGMPPAPRTAAPAAAQEAANPAASIRGRVEVGAELSGQLPPAATLFVIARRAGATAGPPLAVRRIASASLPLDFEIGPQHAMIQGMPFVGDIQLTARLDGDGDAMTRLAGDLSGSAEAPVEPGTRGVRIVLDQRL
jgi:hypothetical protein